MNHNGARNFNAARDNRGQDRRVEEVRHGRHGSSHGKNGPMKIIVGRKSSDMTEISNRHLKSLVEQAAKIENNPYRSVLRKNSASFDLDIGTLQATVAKIRLEMGMSTSGSGRNGSANWSGESKTPNLDGLPVGNGPAMADLDDRISKLTMVYPAWKDKIQYFIKDTAFYAKLCAFRHHLADWKRDLHFTDMVSVHDKGNRPTTCSSFSTVLYPECMMEVLMERFSYSAAEATMYRQVAISTIQQAIDKRAKSNSKTGSVMLDLLRTDVEKGNPPSTSVSGGSGQRPSRRRQRKLQKKDARHAINSKRTVEGDDLVVDDENLLHYSAVDEMMDLM